MKSIRPVATIHNGFCEKFGIPRQSGMVKGCLSKIVLEPEFRTAEAVRGLEGFSHIWLIWGFSKVGEERPFSATVRPPRLGGNTRVGVFASRSPFRPNTLAISAVRLLKVETEAADGPILVVEGADLLDGTPIYDIKPYIPYADSIPEASDGYTVDTRNHRLETVIPETLADMLPEEVRGEVLELLALDPRTSYVDDPKRIWGMSYGGWNINFTVEENKLTVTEITAL